MRFDKLGDLLLFLVVVAAHLGQTRLHLLLLERLGRSLFFALLVSELALNGLVAQQSAGDQE